MLIIRLARTGRKNDPNFRIVLQEKFRKPTGKAIEFLGFYNPRLKSKRIKEERVKYWISQGAQMSATVHNLLVEEKIIVAPKRKASKTKIKNKHEAEAESRSATEEKQKEIPKSEGVAQEEEKSSSSDSKAQPEKQKEKPDVPKEENGKTEKEDKK